MEELKWRFPLAGGGNTRGIGDSGIESFTGNRIGSLAREVIQNSLDAKLNNNDPVIVEFASFNLENDLFPGKEDLLHNMNLALKEAKVLRSNKTKVFYEKAIEILNHRWIPFLRISDFNTIGLEGVEKERHSDWHYLVKAQGMSDKADTAGGSFGIGKNASFAVSHLRTVFYETLNQRGYKGSQGVSNLISYRVEEKNDHTQGIGYYAVGEKNNAYLNHLSIDKGFQRTAFGTDIYIAGALVDDNLENNIVGAVLESFMYAIYIGTLEVVVNNTRINNKLLSKVVKKYETTLKQETLEMYELLTDENSYVFNENILTTLVPDIELRLILKENSSRRISMVRNPGMKITEFSGFQRAYQFSGMVIIKGPEINSLLRKIENPQHDAWEPERLAEKKEDKDRALNTISEIRRRISSRLSELHETDLSDYSDIFGASDYIPQISDDSEVRAQQKVDDVTTGVEVTQIFAPPASDDVLSYDDGDALMELDGDEIIDVMVAEEKDEYEDDFVKRNKIETESKKGRKVSLVKQNYRIIVLDKTKGHYRVNININREGTYIIKILLLDEQGNKVNKYLYLTEVFLNNDVLETEKDFIGKTFLREGFNIFDVKTNLTEYASIGVELYEV